jgi:hypothetical protein
MLRMNCLGSLNFSYHFRYVPKSKGKIFITKLVVENDTLVEKFVYMFHSFFNDNNNINHVHLCDGICAEKLNWPLLGSH